jgi:AcrR family transcriptional regulator
MATLKVVKAKEKRRRLSPTVREKQIVDEAIQFFAEVGFAGRTRELAKRIGITQPLLYRYFPTKEELIDRVFDEVFVRPLDRGWAEKILDRSTPLDERLKSFYIEYGETVHRYEWIRIYMFSGLKGDPLNRRYIRMIEDEFLKPMCGEIRHHCDLPSIESMPIGDMELEQLWILHGGLFYYAVRKNIFHSRVHNDYEKVVVTAIEVLLEGIKATYNGNGGMKND